MKNGRCIAIGGLLLVVCSSYSMQKLLDEQLHQAAKSGNVAHIMDLIQQESININAPGNWRQTPLFEAVDNGHLKVVQILLDAGADPKIAGSRGKDPFGTAMKHGYVEIAEALIKAGVDVNRNKGMALIHAASSGNVPMVSMLIRNGAAIDATNQFRNTALIMAANTKNTDTAKVLIDAGADVNIIGNRRMTALMHAVRDRNVDLVKALLDAGADVCIIGMNGKSAVAMAPTEELKRILTEAETMQGLCKKMQGLSLETNLTDTMKLSGISLNEQLHQAAKSGNVAHVIDLIQQEGININAPGNWRQTPLFEAVDNGHLRVVQVLLDAGADPKIVGSRGKDPFVAAMKHGYVEIAEALIHAGVDVNNAGRPVGRYMGGPYLIAAASNGDIGMVAMLIRNAANINARDRYGNTALIMSSGAKKSDVAKLLVQAGADVNVIGNRRTTALMNAVRANDVELVKALIEAGADVCIIGINGKSAVAMAPTEELKRILTEVEKRQGYCTKM